MGKVLEFPKPKDKSDQDYDVAIECVDLAVHLFHVLEDEIAHIDSPYCKNMNFEDQDSREAQDMYVIANLLSSMFIRHNGVKHTMQPYLDDLYDILLAQTGD